MDMKQIMVATEPDMIIYENNLMAIAAMQKSVGINPQEFVGNKLIENYTKLINGKLVNCIKSMWKDTDTPYTIDIQKILNVPLDNNSKLDAFDYELDNINIELAKRSIKGVIATSYIVGENICNWFRELGSIGRFVDNTGGDYPDDLIGWYKGIPVLRHVDIDINEGFAIHKTDDGMLAPVMRGIYNPITISPLIGNYNNPTQLSAGLYYQENVVPLVPGLIQKFIINA